MLAFIQRIFRALANDIVKPHFIVRIHAISVCLDCMSLPAESELIASYSCREIAEFVVTNCSPLVLLQNLQPTRELGS
jgi:hypothetical protein